MKGYLVVATLLVLGLLVCPNTTFAQEEQEVEYSWGIVSSISSGQIVVTEYDYESYEDVDVTYTLGPEVGLQNVESLKDIKVGDSVEIDYVKIGDKRVAKSISVERPLYEEEYAPSETYEEEPESELDFE